MTWSGYLLDLVVFFEFGGAAVAQGAVQPGAVVPGDVLDDRPPGGSLGGPGLKVEELAFERGDFGWEPEPVKGMPKRSASWRRAASVPSLSASPLLRPQDVK